MTGSTGCSWSSSGTCPGTGSFRRSCWSGWPTRRRTWAAPLPTWRRQGVPDETLEQLMARLKERLQEQTEEHNGGNYWVGTQGRSPFGNSGVHPGGIRIGGTGQHRTAVSVAGERGSGTSGETPRWMTAASRRRSVCCGRCPSSRTGSWRWTWTAPSTIPATTAARCPSATAGPGKTR